MFQKGPQEQFKYENFRLFLPLSYMSWRHKQVQFFFQQTIFIYIYDCVHIVDDNLLIMIFFMSGKYPQCCLSFTVLLWSRIGLTYLHITITVHHLLSVFMTKITDFRTDIKELAVWNGPDKESCIFKKNCCPMWLTVCCNVWSRTGCAFPNNPIRPMVAPRGDGGGARPPRFQKSATIVKKITQH